MRDAGCRMRDAGCRMRDAGCGMQDAGCRMQDAGCRMQDAGCGRREARCEMRDRLAGFDDLVEIVASMSYRNLEIWTLSRELVVDIHKMTLTKLPKFEMFEEGTQIRKSMKSVKSTIVEGY